MAPSALNFSTETPASLETGENAPTVTATPLLSQASPADRARLIAAARLIVRYLLDSRDAENEHEVDGALHARAAGHD